MELLENGVLKIPILTDEQLESKSYKMRYMNKMDNYIITSKNMKKYYFIYIKSIGRKFITLELLIKFTSLSSYALEKIFKIPNIYDKDYIKILKELQGKILEINDIKYSFDANKIYFCEINYIHHNLIHLPNCSVCLEENKLFRENGYFNCIHNIICDDCYKKLQVKICPYCRST